MNDYVTKKDFDELKDEFRRHTGILLEEFQKSINFVIDGQDVLTQRIDKLDSKVNILGTKVDKLDSKVNILETKVDKISDELLSHRNNTELHAPTVKQKGKKQA